MDQRGLAKHSTSREKHKRKLCRNVRVCVWTIWKDVKFPISAAIWTHFCYSFTIYHCRGTIHVLCAMVQRSGHSTCGYHGWSPWRTCQFFWNEKRLNPRTSKSNSFSIHPKSLLSIFSACTVFAIWTFADVVKMDQLYWAASELSCKKTSLRFLTSNLPNMPISFTGLFCAREMHSTSVIR